MYKTHPVFTKYKISKCGKVLGSRGRELKLIKHHTGYVVITIMRNDNTQCQQRVHRLVWETFMGDIPEDRVINHLDGNKENNNLSNLEVVSQSGNAQHAFANGLRKPLVGSKSGTSKLTENQAINLIREIKEGKTNKELGEKYGLHPNYVSLIRHNKRWKHLPR